VEPGELLTTTRLVIVAGKGGVGKTTVAAALACAARRGGLTSLISTVDGQSGLASMFGREPLTYEDVELSSGIRARTLTPDEALLEYLADHGLARVSRRLVSSGLVDLVATAVPGIKDILVLGKVKQLERARAADLILVDAPAAGHAITFLLAARALLDAVRVGPIDRQAREVLELLTDPARCQVILVTLPEETPVNELIDTAYHLEDRVGVSLGPIVVNGLYEQIDGLDPGAVLTAEDLTSVPAGELRSLSAAAEFRCYRSSLQREQVARLDAALPLPQLHLPYLFTADLGPDDLEVLASALLGAAAALPGAHR
jgi:anion-transporting  ArsA/GET3 family ATPase